MKSSDLALVPRKEKKMRIEWTEERFGETFLIGAKLVLDEKKKSMRWVFDEKSAWEVRWFEIHNPAPELIAQAEKLFRETKVVYRKQLKRPKAA